jgi:phospholipase C
MNLSPDSSGVPTTPVYAFHLIDGCIEGLSPDWIAAHWDFNVENPSSDTPGTLGTPTNAPDGFVVSAASAALANSENDVQGIRAMGYYTGTDLPYHYWLATEFATSDSWFNPAPMRTQPNRYYMMGATSGGYAYPFTPPEPPIQSKTIFDSLQAAGVSWKIYTQLPGGYTYASAFAGFMSRYGSLETLSRIRRFRNLSPMPRAAICPRLFSSKNQTQMKNRMVSATTSSLA